MRSKLREVEDDFSVRYSRGASLYLNPTNGFGDEVEARNGLGQKIDRLYSDGPYRSAAEEFSI
ncbi:hypothetical protein [Endothiovibrio diazotrophicus]